MGHILVKTLEITSEHVYVFPYIICMLYYFLYAVLLGELRLEQQTLLGLLSVNYRLKT